VNAFLEVLNQLHDSGSDFVVVGGVAAALHGGSRSTFDLDGATEVDLLVSESDNLDGLRERASRVNLDGRVFLVASIDDLIAMKRVAGRPQDLLDISELTAIRDRMKSSG